MSFIADKLSGMASPFDAPKTNAVPPAQSQPQSQPEAAPRSNPLIQGNPSQGYADAVKSVDRPSIEVPSFLEEEPKAPEPPPIEASDQEHDKELPSEASIENWNKFRESLKEQLKVNRELETKFQETSKKLDKFEKGETVPDIIRAKDERIQQLEPFEKIVSLKLSPEYQENFVKPALSLRGELEKIGQDYGVPEELMHQAVGIENRKELNNFLSQHFDDVGGLEVKRIVTELQDLGTQALEAEKEPAQALQSLKAQYLERQEEEKRERAQTFETIAKDAWQNALEKTKAEGAYKELILHPTDTDFNKKVVEPIQYRASVQYGALVKKLSENGLKTLPPDLAAGLARMVQLSIGGALVMDAKRQAEAERNAVIQNTKRTNGYMRPTIGGSNGSAHETKTQAQQPLLNPRTAAEQAARIFNK
jgi:hypothetical protein